MLKWPLGSLHEVTYIAYTQYAIWFILSVRVRYYFIVTYTQFSVQSPSGNRCAREEEGMLVAADYFFKGCVLPVGPVRRISKNSNSPGRTPCIRSLVNRQWLRLMYVFSVINGVHKISQTCQSICPLQSPLPWEWSDIKVLIMCPRMLGLWLLMSWLCLLWIVGSNDHHNDWQILDRRCKFRHICHFLFHCPYF